MGWHSEASAESAPAGERLIDVPIESLPFVDEHETVVAATIEETWAALVAVAGGFTSGRLSGRIAGVLGCEQTTRRGEPGQIGSTAPGFVVARSVRPSVLALMGKHRFSRYALVFRLSESPAGPVRVSAETRAEFPGLAGRIYRTAVIGTRGHVLATNIVLRAVRLRAERRSS